jgi:hypothetical protein
MSNITLEEMLGKDFGFSLSLVYIVLFINSIQVELSFLNGIDYIIIRIHVLVQKVVELRGKPMISADFLSDKLVALLCLYILDNENQIESGK